MKKSGWMICGICMNMSSVCLHAYWLFTGHTLNVSSFQNGSDCLRDLTYRNLGMFPHQRLVFFGISNIIPPLTNPEYSCSVLLTNVRWEYSSKRRVHINLIRKRIQVIVQNPSSVLFQMLKNCTGCFPKVYD